MRGSRAVLLQAATGSGKSIMAADFISGANKKGNSTWFIVPRKQLLRQMSNTYDEFGLDHGMVAAGRQYDGNQLNHICSMQTLVSRIDSLPPPRIAVIDECHFGGATMDLLINYFREHGTIIIGLSATPLRNNGDPMGNWYTSMVQGESISSLMKQGYLSNYRLFQGVATDIHKARIISGEYVIKDLEAILWLDKKRISGIATAYKQHAMGLRTIAYGVSVADCEVIARNLNAAGIPSAAISGKTPDAERVRIIEQFADGKILVLVNCDLLTFGFDLSAQVGRDVPIEAMIDAAPTKSLGKELQKNGRALRKKDKPAIILDHAGNTLPDNHGLPDDDREWSLLGKEKRGGSSERSIAVRQCDKCHFCFPAAVVCPFCGHVHEVKSREMEEVEAVMAEVDKDFMREAAKTKRMEVGRARTMADLQVIQKERGYKPSWVFIQAKLKGIRA